MAKDESAIPGIEEFSQRINTDTVGILWLTDATLAYDSPGAYEINYLLDGVLTQSLAAQTPGEEAAESSSNFFLGKSFGMPFFVGHVVFKSKKDLDKILKALETAKPFIQENKQVYLLNNSEAASSQSILKDIQKKYSDVSFEIF